MRNSNAAVDQEQAEAIALSALAFLAEEPERLGRFLALTGMGPAELRAQASRPQTLAAVLGHLLADESLLLVFAGMKDVSPERIAPAHDLLVRASASGAGS